MVRVIPVTVPEKVVMILNNFLEVVETDTEDCELTVLDVKCIGGDENDQRESLSQMTRELMVMAGQLLPAGKRLVVSEETGFAIVDAQPAGK